MTTEIQPKGQQVCLHPPPITNVGSKYHYTFSCSWHQFSSRDLNCSRTSENTILAFEHFSFNNNYNNNNNDRLKN